MQLGNHPPSSFSQRLAGSSGTGLPVALRKVAYRRCNALAWLASELPLLIRTRSYTQRCWHGAEGFRVLRITGKGDSGGKKNHMGSFFSPTSAFRHYGFGETAICSPDNFLRSMMELGSVPKTAESDSFTWLSPLCLISNIKHISLPFSKSVTVLLERAVWVLKFCPALMISCQSATELVLGWDFWSSCLQVFPWHKARDNLALWA